jgi:hypothetical protein
MHIVHLLYLYACSAFNTVYIQIPQNHSVPLLESSAERMRSLCCWLTKNVNHIGGVSACMSLSPGLMQQYMLCGTQDLC